MKTFEEYSQEASKTINYNLRDDQLTYAALGLAGETGEVVEIIKKWFGQGHALDREKIIYELGDVLWYINCICKSLQVPMELVAETNIAKLRQRYGEKFDEEKSINRTDNM